jgi:hypothetical protein
MPPTQPFSRAPTGVLRLKDAGRPGDWQGVMSMESAPLKLKIESVSRSPGLISRRAMPLVYVGTPLIPMSLVTRFRMLRCAETSKVAVVSQGRLE